MRRLVGDILTGETARFLVTGAGAAALFALLGFIALSVGVPPLPGTLGAYATTLAASYTAQRAWTFGGRHPHGRALPRYIAAQLLCAGVTAAMAQVLSRHGGSPLMVSGSVTLTGSAMSFCLSRFWVFPPRRSE